MLIKERPIQKNLILNVYYSNIASRNQVIKYRATQDKIAKKENIICFEIEAVGLIDKFLCLVI
jgi:hypothetical protein